MHGAVLAELKKYVEAELGDGGWVQLCRHSGLGPRDYQPLASYPDAEAMALVKSACEMTGKTPSTLLRDFGRFLAPELMKMFWGAVDPAWKTLDFLEHTENTIHTLVRAHNPEATPPTLAVSRPAPNEALIVYRSARRMCALAKGLTEGVAAHYGERVVISESTCMHHGDAECRIAVKLID